MYLVVCWQNSAIYQSVIRDTARISREISQPKLSVCFTLTVLVFPRWICPSAKKWPRCVCCTVALPGAQLVAMLVFAEHFVRTLQVITLFRQTVSKTVAAETRVLSQASPCGILVGTKRHWNRFLLRMLEIPVSVSLPMRHAHSLFVCHRNIHSSQLTASVHNTLKNVRVCAYNVAQSCLCT